MKAEAKEGRDPALLHRRAKHAVRSPRTLSDLMVAYLIDREGNVAPKTLKIERDLLQGVLVPVLGDRLLDDIAPIDVGSVVSAYAARLKREGRSAGTNANKLLAVTKRLFRWGRGSGLLSREDPTSDLSRPAKEKPRDRVLFDGKLLTGPESALNEIGAFVEALRSDPPAIPVSRASRIALHLTLLFGFRALEITSLEWRTVDLAGETPSVTVTSSKTKAGLRKLPLPRQAVSLFQEQRDAMNSSERFVFPAEQGAERAAHLHPESLSRAFARALDRLGMSHAVLHDLRRTALSGLIELGHESVTGRIAGHAGTGVMGRHYDRSTRFDAMKNALQEWADAVDNASVRSGR